MKAAVTPLVNDAVAAILVHGSRTVYARLTFAHGTNECRVSCPSCEGQWVRNKPNSVGCMSSPSKPLASIPCNSSRWEEHTSELQSLMRNSYAVFCLNKKRISNQQSKNT